MEEREKRLLRYVELATRDTRGACDESCKKEMLVILAEIACSHEEAIQEGKALMERLS